MSSYLCLRAKGQGHEERQCQSQILSFLCLSFSSQFSSITSCPLCLPSSHIFSLTENALTPDFSWRHIIDWNKTNRWCRDQTDLLFLTHYGWQDIWQKRGFLRDWAGINSLKWFIMYAQSVKLEVFSNYLARTTLWCMAWQHELTVSSHYHSTFKSHNRSHPISAINGKELLFIFALDHLSGRTGFPQSEKLKEISRSNENKKLQ